MSKTGIRQTIIFILLGAGSLLALGAVSPPGLNTRTVALVLGAGLLVLGVGLIIWNIKTTR